MLPWQIQFGLFRFRSPLLTESRLISLPYPTQMLHFGLFALPSEKQGSSRRDLIRKSRDQRSHAPTPGLSQLATSFIAFQAESFPNRRLCTFSPAISYTIAAPETLREHFRRPRPLFLYRYCGAFCDPIHDGHRRLSPTASFIPCSTHGIASRSWSHEPRTLYTGSPGRKTKEVIQPQVPLRLPCYDFSPVADPRFDSAN